MTALVSWLWQGMAVVLAVKLGLRLAGSLNATTRHLVWWAALVSVLALPFASATVELASAVTPASAVGAASTTTGGLLVLPVAPTWLTAILVGVWLGLVLLGASRILRGLFHIARLKRRARPFPLAAEARLTLWMSARHTGRPVTLSISDDVRAPCALGLGRAVILLPAHLSEALDTRGLDLIVMHEYAHVQRRDDWWRLIQAVIEAVAGVHPAIVSIGREIDLEREAACDDFVVARSRGARSYARCLAAVADLSLRAPGCRGASPLLAPGAMRSPSALRQRVSRLLSGRGTVSLRPAWGGFGAALVTLATLVVALGGVAPVVAFADAPVEAIVEATRSAPSLPDARLSARNANSLVRETRSPVAPGRGSAGSVAGPTKAPGRTARARAARPAGDERSRQVTSAQASDQLHSRALETLTPEPRETDLPRPPLDATALHAHIDTLVLQPATREASPASPDIAGDQGPWRALADAGAAIGSGTKKSGITVGTFFARAGQAVTRVF